MPIRSAAQPHRSRNQDWFHMVNEDIISMPDKWEYPWYAAWDLAFHTLPLAIVDLDFAKQQLELMLRARYIHPSGQIPAYEWNFATSTRRSTPGPRSSSHRIQQALRGESDVEFLKRDVPQADAELHLVGEPQGPSGQNVFEGGFLGLDNIGIFDRSSPLPTGGYLEQADGTAWMRCSVRTYGSGNDSCILGPFAAGRSRLARALRSWDECWVQRRRRGFAEARESSRPAADPSRILSPRQSS